MPCGICGKKIIIFSLVRYIVYKSFKHVLPPIDKHKLYSYTNTES